MKKRVLHISHTDIRSDSRILKEIEAIKNIDGVEVFGLGVLLDTTEAPPKTIVDVRIETIRLYTKIFKWLPRPIRYAFNFVELSLRLILRGRTIHPQIVHCHDTLVLPAGVVLKWITKSRLIYDAHELESNKNGQTKLLSVSTLVMERFSWSSVDHFVTVSDRIVQWYFEKFGPKPSTLVLNSPKIKSSTHTTNEVCDEETQYLHSKFQIPEKAKIFLYLGIIGKGRGIEIALDAFSRCHPDAHFVMVGYGALVPLAKASASRFSNIHYHEAVPHDEVVAIARSADVGLCLIENVSLSDYYCLPNKLFEYAFAGLYVLSCDFPEIRRVVDHHGLGSTCELDSNSLVEAIEKICVHGIHRNVRDLSLLAWETQATRLQESYKELLSR